MSIVDERRDHGGERSADDEGDGKLDEVAPHDEVLETLHRCPDLSHVVMEWWCRPSGGHAQRPAQRDVPAAAGAELSRLSAHDSRG